MIRFVHLYLYGKKYFLVSPMGIEVFGSISRLATIKEIFFHFDILLLCGEEIYSRLLSG